LPIINKTMITAKSFSLKTANCAELFFIIF
jgi:hypothetical protein